MMVPGMGAKISVLIQISFARVVCTIEQLVDVMSGKRQPVIHQAGCFWLISILYLMKILKSSADICRWMQPFETPTPVRSFNVFSSGVFYATVF
jgi:hypothetical protein